MWFNIYSNCEQIETIHAIGIDKARYYLKEFTDKNGDVFSGIISCALNGFEEIEKKITEKWHEIINKPRRRQYI